VPLCGQDAGARDDPLFQTGRRSDIMDTHVNSGKRIAIGSDHVGYPLKEEIKNYLDELGYACQDFGAHSVERTDYPLFARDVTSAVASNQADLGILICGTGVGMSITANKVKGIRAVVCSEPYSWRLSLKAVDMLHDWRSFPRSKPNGRSKKRPISRMQSGLATSNFLKRERRSQRQGGWSSNVT
jgi:hypothetical protein